jgi:Protein of unknown function DUF262/Protein of unknown function (DUF1524)
VANSIEAKELPITKIFSSDFSFEIPSYQRPYAWGADQVFELFNDLLDSLREGPISLDIQELSPYFLGSIVLIKAAESPNADVVDGQQRLTTLTILLAVLRDASQGDLKGSLQRMIFQKKDDLTGDPECFRLKVRNRDQEFFKAYIQEPAGTNRIPGSDVDLSDSQVRMRGNAIKCKELVGTLNDIERDRLAKYIVQRCYLVVVSAENQDSAYKVFAVMNDRGLDLSTTDILKAEVLSQFQGSEAEETKYTEVWENLEDELGRDNFENLFSHIRMIRVRDKARKSLVEEFKKSVLKDTTSKSFIDDQLIPCATIFEKILDSAYEAHSKSDEINQYLRILNRLDNDDWIPVALNYISRNREKPEAILMFLSALERLAYSMFIRRDYPTTRIRRYGQILKSIADDDDLYSNGSPLDLTTIEIAETKEKLGGPIYTLTRVARPVLLRLDEVLSAGGARYDFATISVEHVLPQSPPAGSEWCSIFPVLEEREAWVHRLGNLALLPFRKNSQASNYDFEKKKNVYFLKDGKVAPFPLTTEIIGTDVWNQKALEERQDRLFGVLVNTWRL